MNLDIGKELLILFSVTLYSIALVCAIYATKIGGKRANIATRYVVDTLVALGATAVFWALFVVLDDGVIKALYVLVALGETLVFYRITSKIMVKIKARAKAKSLDSAGKKA